MDQSAGGIENDGPNGWTHAHGGKRRSERRATEVGRDPDSGRGAMPVRRRRSPSLTRYFTDDTLLPFSGTRKVGLKPTFFCPRKRRFYMNAEFIAMLDYLERERGIKRDVLVE